MAGGNTGCPTRSPFGLSRHTEYEGLKEPQIKMCQKSPLLLVDNKAAKSDMHDLRGHGCHLWSTVEKEEVQTSCFDR